jgi:hypothetical protein
MQMPISVQVTEDGRCCTNNVNRGVTQRTTRRNAPQIPGFPSCSSNDTRYKYNGTGPEGLFRARYAGRHSGLSIETAQVYSWCCKSILHVIVERILGHTSDVGVSATTLMRLCKNPLLYFTGTS